MTVFTVDRYRKVTMVEGALVHPRQPGQGGSEESNWFVGQEVEALFYKWFVAEDIVSEDYKLHPRLVEGPIQRILGSLDSILAGKAGLRLEEYKISEQSSTSFPSWFGFVDAAQMAVRFGCGCNRSLGTKGLRASSWTSRRSGFVPNISKPGSGGTWAFRFLQT
jgi:hypothetical protein